MDGYSATIESYLLIGEQRYQLAKTNGDHFTLGEDCVALRGTQAQFEITIDGDTQIPTIILPDGMEAGERRARNIDPTRV